MASAARPIPEGFHALTPHLIVDGAAKAIDFYAQAFGATELFRNADERSGLIMNAQLRIGDSILMLCDQMPEWGCLGPTAESPSPVVVHLYVDDVQAVYDQAVAAGATPVMPVSDTFWGDRYAKITDPYGHAWSIATRVEDLTPEEITERAKAAFAS